MSPTYNECLLLNKKKEVIKMGCGKKQDMKEKKGKKK